MFSALRPTWLLSLAGQTSTHRAQPVQSSGATWMEYRVSGNSFQLALRRLEGCRGLFQVLRFVNLGADHRMRANEDALAALDAQIGCPLGDFQGDVALFPLGGTGGEGAIDREGAYG